MLLIYASLFQTEHAFDLQFEKIVSMGFFQVLGVFELLFVIHDIIIYLVWYEYIFLQLRSLAGLVFVFDVVDETFDNFNIFCALLTFVD